MVQTHMIKKFKVQPEILELIRALPLVTRASERRERSQRVFIYDEQQESLPQGAEGEEWMDREGFCEQYELE